VTTLPMPSLRGPVAALPREVYFEVTNRCNLLCETCPRTHNELEAPADLGYARMVEIADELPVIDRALLHGVGEPLLNPELPEMIAYFAGRGAHVVFNTNGILLDDRRGDAVTRAGLAEVRVSLDAATPQTFKVVRGADVLPKILRNVEAFTTRRAARGETRPLVSIWATTLQENLDELPDLVRLAADVGVRRVHLQRLVFNGIGLAVEEQSVFRDLSDRQEQILASCRRVASEVGVDLSGSGGTDGDGAFGAGATDDLAWQGCRRPWKVLYVTAQGTVMPCCIAPFATTDIPAISLGNVADGVAKVWNGPTMRSFRTRHQSPSPPVPCGPCGSQWSL
jgi:MoaA/NifB/PqqE/SkfB family radical SAM enzyme